MLIQEADVTTDKYDNPYIWRSGLWSVDIPRVVAIAASPFRLTAATAKR
jgi:hypothetical protein